MHQRTIFTSVSRYKFPRVQTYLGLRLSACSCLHLSSSLKLKLLEIKLCNCKHKTSHGCHLLIHARKNIGKICTAVFLNGIVQTHHVARRLTSMKFAIAAIQTADISLEPVIQARLQCQVSLDEGEICLQDSQCLIAGLLFMPHGSSEDQPLADKSSAIVVNHSYEQHYVHTDITLAQLEEIILTKAVEYFLQNADALVYQIVWKSKQGTAYILVVKARRKMQSTQRMIQGGKIVQRQDGELQNWPYVIPHFLNLWVAHAPIRLQSSIMNWIQKDDKNQFAISPLRLTF